MSEQLERVFLVTGAGGNVGRAVIARLASQGSRIAAVYHHAPAAETPWLSLTADLAREDEIEAAFEQTERALGPVWGVLHVAGGWKGGQSLADSSVALFEEMLTTNLRSAFLIGRAAMRRMRERNGGRIVFVASHSAATATKLAGSGAYAVAKSGVIGLTRALAEEGERHNVLVNCVAPGTIATDANRAAMPGADTSRWVSVEEVAEAMVLAATPGSPLNGDVLLLRG